MLMKMHVPGLMICSLINATVASNISITFQNISVINKISESNLIVLVHDLVLKNYI